MTAALVGTAPTAVGGGATIQAAGTSFSPANIRVSQGTTVSWTFTGSHSTTSNQSFWNSGVTSAPFNQDLPSAGKFPYHCTVHAGMKGSIAVPLKASGSAGSGWTLRWSQSPVSEGRAFDVQFRRQGTTAWQSFKTDTTTASALFNRSRAGTYQLRARTTNTAADPAKESGWSAVISRRIS
jgi:plastocyanin